MGIRRMRDVVSLLDLFMLQVAKWRMMTRGLMETLETRATWAAGRRLELRLDPSEVDGLEVLRPDVRIPLYPSYFLREKRYPFRIM